MPQFIQALEPVQAFISKLKERLSKPDANKTDFDSVILKVMDEDGDGRISNQEVYDYIKSNKGANEKTLRSWFGDKEINEVLREVKKDLKGNAW